ncbi:MAG: GlmU family protein [Bacteroidales bacterium]|jgi:UDP-N-acetylglucosamine diphosphorylase/glucosamine-1-phosphate N-acetyltransferase|nr:GlmU family protein [Bacteroidales bacterium]MDD3724804.1 GlmU family protein [Bacteroidales bacterium]MDD4545284.1 GlmU family protein [Bacteroidales bacterium]MDY0054325.1 GlmU family protein [Bacteroidales bacterium]
MNYILFDDASRESLKPLSYIRPVCDIRVGIMTIREKWEKYLETKTSTLTEAYLSKKYPIELSDSMILINGSICPTEELVEEIKKLSLNQVLVFDDESGDSHIIAIYKTKDDFISDSDESEKIEYKKEFTRIVNTWDIFVHNDKEIRKDFDLITKGRKSAKISETNKLINPDNIFVEEGAKIECSSLNATEGPIYIGKDAEIMEGSMVRGTFAMCEHSVLKLGTKIYGATTLGPYAKVAGELANVVIFGYSNKAHDGYIGSSVIGEWCNIGADSNASNLKNTYEEVRLWSIEKNTFVPTGQTFCGTIFGDHTKCGINTMFNTGTVLGISSNVFGHGYQRNFIPSFAWGGNAGLKLYELEKSLEVARKMMARRGVELSKEDEDILKYIYQSTLKKKKLR